MICSPFSGLLPPLSSVHNSKKQIQFIKPDSSAQLLLIFGASQARWLGKPSPPMRLAGLNPHHSEATRSGRALGQGPWALTHPRRGPSTPADSEE